MNITNTALLTVAGGAVAGIAAGTMLERLTHDRLEAKKDVHSAMMAEGQAWVDGANRHFGGDIVADRQRERDLDAKIEDYKIANEPPEGVAFGRGSNWHGDVYIQEPSRDGFWFGALFGGGFGTAIAGAGLGGAISSANRGGTIAAGLGVGLLGGAMAATIVSNWTH